MMGLNRPAYNTETFSDVFENKEDFLEFYNSCGIPKKLKDESIKTLYFLLYAKFGNSPIANSDVNQFKYKVMSIIFQSGPTWERRLEIQDTLRNMSEEDLRIGSKSIYNHAFNPSTEPSTDTIEELRTINDQNTNKNKRGRLEAYALLWDTLASNITSQFLEQFRSLFKIFVKHENPILYEGDD